MATGTWFVLVCPWRRIWSRNGGVATFEALAVPQRRTTVRPRNAAAAALNFKIELGIG
jgi:hypothetical protein